MYLKSIEVNGFKSFANKIVFEFNKGITVIVGPNGSGKSNVGDAVRWVLGEQSAKQLRGAKMEDVIFSGTEIRKAQSSAYVAITLDNSDHALPIEYTEVKVARRVYRSGESEYLINGSPCRLKDIQELFLDTGIGKEGYSIIGQGQIDKILSGKPEERRELFDEAAGIVKFKKRKKLAEKNLEDERLNLSRINDILKEIENQIVPLEKQSKVAREYLSYRDSLRSYEVNKFILDYDRIHEDVKKLEDNLSISTSQLEESNIEFEKTKLEYEKLEKELEEHNTLIDNLKNSLSEKKISTEKFEGEIRVLNEQLVAIKNNKKSYGDRITRLQKDIDVKKADLDKCNNDYNSNEENIEKLTLKKYDLDEQFNSFSKESGDYSNKIDELQKDIYNIMEDDSNTKSQIQRLETLLEQVNIRKVSLNSKLLEQKTKEGEVQSRMDSFSNSLENVCNELADIEDTVSASKEKIGVLQSNIDKYKSEVATKQQELLRERSKLESLKNMTERYEGYGNSIKRVMELKSKQQGILGVVADIIKVESKYETAVEIALGGSIQNIVIDNENTAKYLIEYLKKNKYGRATFLPLTTVSNKSGFNYPNALSEKGVIGLCHTLIKTEDKFAKLIESLVGRVLVVDNIDNAILIARKYHNSIRIVTLEGDLFNTGGSISGGAYKNTSNLLGRRREIEDMEKNISTYTNDIAAINLELEKLRHERDKEKNIINDASSNQQKLFIRQNTLKMNLTQVENEYQKLQEFYSNISEETNDIVADEKRYSKDIEKLSLKIKENEIEKRNKEELISNINTLLTDVHKGEQEHNQKMTNISIELSGYEQKRDYILAEEKRLKEELAKVQEEIDELQYELDNSEDNSRQKNDAITEKNAIINDLKSDIDDLESKLNDSRTKRDDVNNKHKSFFAKRDELSNTINNLDKEIFRLNNQKDKSAEKLDSLINYMWEEYEITYSSAEKYRVDDIGSYNEIKNEVAELKNKIKRLGDVNVNAIEDYRVLAERYELLNTQHNDLIESEKVLINIIEELDTEMRKQFEEKFGFIKSQFDVVFRKLFGGGKGTLELMEDEDVLEAGIKIIAQPPGKKLQNMMQMSGGEKALTAIALLFSIQNLKPSPFCLLDEIEAALDDANVKRYAEYLSNLTKHTQFIVITHRRGTMAAADILYGITMQEKGVSTLVSVNLIEDELDK